MTLYEQFEAEFQPKLGNTKRWEAFSFIAKELLSTELAPYILETGCLRQPDNWAGDGQSTRVWNWIIEKAEGLLWSVDIEDKNCAIAEQYCGKYSKVTTMDSIKYLRTDQCMSIDLLDLLYLDSFDYNRGREHLAELHHIGELACVYDKLPSGCLIAVDDCHRDDYGKHVLVKAFFDRIGVKPEVSGYITVWRKP